MHGTVFIFDRGPHRKHIFGSVLAVARKRQREECTVSAVSVHGRPATRKDREENPR